MKLTELITDFLKKGFIIDGVTLIHDKLGFYINGFYKSGSITIYEEDNELFVLARYGEITPLSSENPFDDIVWLNYDWWVKSRDRYDGWKVPESKWLPYLLEKGYIKEEIKIEKVYR